MVHQVHQVLQVKEEHLVVMHNQDNLELRVQVVLRVFQVLVVHQVHLVHQVHQV